jgi:Protein of unknown function (DUF3297)
MSEETETRTEAATPSSDAPPPDHLSIDPASPHYDSATLERGIGIRFNGVEKTTVEEYCVSEGWVKVAAGKARDRKGRPILLKLKGEVVAYFLDVSGTGNPA